MVTIGDERFISAACNIAMESQMLQRHGCVAVVSGKIVGTGCNNYRNYSKDGMLSNCCSCHAEIAATRSAIKNCRVVHRSTKGR
tara:strand:+ start:934 stop:1185 length:252 start_codon:yes stop_codon:yes gene_type:complete